MDKYETRRHALLALRDRLGYGAVAKIASAIGKEPNYVSRMLYEPGKRGRKRIGEDSVELLNRVFPGWLETADLGGSGGERIVPARADVATFDVLDVAAACGPGALNADYPEVVTSIAMPIAEAHRLIGTPNRRGTVKIIVAAKDSMAPTIQPNDLLFVDTSVNEYSGESIYVIAHGGELLCKRLSLVGRRLMVISDNTAYPAWDWEERPDTTRIVGRVLRALPMEFKDFGRV